MRAELVARAQQGDREAFSTLAQGASARLYATARLILRQPDRAEDAVQDTLIEAWRDIRGLRDPDRLDAWLHRLLVRACHRHIRKEQQRRVTEIELPSVLGGHTADAGHALAERDEMERAFRRLTPDQRTILALVYYADLPLADVSAVLGIPIGTTKSRLNRAIAALRAALAADERLLQLARGQTA
ncbi:MAG TPA: RNA polymerase sigma factor [Candidatus Limnocylindrales bacterium]|nr:RNA polymerase sigma factor [Candidatus Limnocylindrales bacterium]